MNSRAKIIKKIILKSERLVTISLSLCPASKNLIYTSMIFHRGAARKVSPLSLMQFTEDLCAYFYKNIKITGIRRSCRRRGPSSTDTGDYVVIDLHEHYFCAETTRDIYSNKISDLLKDDKPSGTNKTISFGFLGEKLKPQRIKYMDMCFKISKFDYISTEKFDRFNTDPKNFTTVLDLKADYKYFIDLAGHTYSTKSYLFLASKRVFFSSLHPKQLKWEQSLLKPWKNFIPLKKDLSDLEENYNKIESNPDLYNQIVSNNMYLIKNELSNESMKNALISEICKHLILK